MGQSEHHPHLERERPTAPLVTMKSVSDPPSVREAARGALHISRVYHMAKRLPMVVVNGERWTMSECLSEPAQEQVQFISELFQEHATDGTFERPWFEYPE